jgi:hypothetical protein
MAQDLPAFADKLGACIGADGELVRSLLMGQHENQGLPAAEFERLARSVSGVDVMAGDEDFVVGASDAPPVPVEISDQVLHRIRDRFAAPNARLDQRRRLGLARFDYAL